MGQGGVYSHQPALLVPIREVVVVVPFVVVGNRSRAKPEVLIVNVAEADMMPRYQTLVNSMLGSLVFLFLSC